MAPRDPILGLNEAFSADTRPGKINLGVGVYCNEEGRIPLLRAKCRLPRRPASRPTRRAATCRSKGSPPTTRAYETAVR